MCISLFAHIVLYQNKAHIFVLLSFKSNNKKNNMQYKHEKLLAEHEINADNLTDELKADISQFNSIKSMLDDVEEDEEVKKIESKLAHLSEHISSEIRDFVNNEVKQDLSDVEVKENILKALLKEEKDLISKQELKSVGYDISKLTDGGEKLKKYALKKQFYEVKYRIIKLA